MLKDLYKKITVLKELFFLSEQDKLFVNFSKQLWDKKDKKKHPLLTDNLAVQIISNEIEEWFRSGYE